MKKRAIIIAVIVLIVISVAIVLFNLPDWLYLKSVYVGLCTPVEIQTPGFILDMNDDLASMGMSSFMVYGTLDGRNINGYEGSFRGVVDVAAYSIPASMTDGSTINGGRGYPVEDRDGKFIQFRYTAERNLVYGQEKTTDTYEVLLFPDKPEQIIVVVHHGQERFAVVAADSVEEAREICKSVGIGK